MKRNDVPRWLPIVALLLASCGRGLGASSAPADLAPSATTAAPSAPRTSPQRSFPADRPIILTTDLDASDLFATAILLRTPGLDVRAIGIDGTGIVHCAAGERNLAWLLAQLGGSQIPFGCGPTGRSNHALPFPEAWRTRSDALYGLTVANAPPRAADGPAVEVLARAIEAAPEPPLIVALGPWTTIAALFAARPDLIDQVAGIHAMAGVFDAPGNVELEPITLADPVEWNVAADPDAFAAVLELGLPVTLVPLDATDDVPYPTDFGTMLAADHAAAGADIAFELELRHPSLATTPGQQLWDELAVALIGQPDLANWATARIRVTLDDRPAGRLVRDPGGREVRYASSADRGRSVAAILAGLRTGPPRPDPFTPAGEIRIAWDGSTCRIDGAPPSLAGETLVRLRNGGAGAAQLVVVAIAKPHTWIEAIEVIRAFDLSKEIQPPPWIEAIEGQLVVGPGSEGLALATLPTGTVGMLCGTGSWPDLTFTPAQSLEMSAP